jgi:hypothetical protein
MRYSGLNLLYYPFRVKLLKGLEDAQKAGIPLKVFESFRSTKRQSELWAQGRSLPGVRVTSQRPGLSYHNYGLAADLVLFIDGKWTWADEHIPTYKKAGPFLEAQGLTWLGNAGDYPHFQLNTPVKVEQFQAWYTQGGLEMVWMELDKIIR